MYKTRKLNSKNMYLDEEKKDGLQVLVSSSIRIQIFARPISLASYIQLQITSRLWDCRDGLRPKATKRNEVKKWVWKLEESLPPFGLYFYSKGPPNFENTVQFVSLKS